MRWPDIFFKSRKSNSGPETVPAEPAGPTEEEKKKIEAREAAEKADSLRALTESGSSQPMARVTKDVSAGAIAATTKPDDRSNVETTRISVASAVAEIGATPSTLRSGAVSLRQRAKLTEDAAALPKSEDSAPTPEEKSSPSNFSKKQDDVPDHETKPASAAVVPAAFPVAVETGSVMEKQPEKNGDSTAPTGAKPEEVKSVDGELSLPKTSSNSGKPETTGSESGTPSHDTTRVRLGDTTPAAHSTAIEPVKPQTDSRHKQEFVLANGERIFGHILSETPQTIYIDHGTLGVLTLPRSQIAKKPIEVILINGDRIVGDLIAETPECMYIKHASLGMLTVPHGQRSTRVVEAIMKDGDRILGEVLAETDSFTVIRSATLGTVAVQHEQVAMLNRKIEQMQLRALPPSIPALEDKQKD